MPHKNNRHRFALHRISIGLMLMLLPLYAFAAEVRVSVDGVSGALRDNVLARLSIYQERKRADISAARIRRLHERAAEEIATALQPFGYYRPRIDPSLRQDDGEWLARYDIDPGTPIPVTLVDVQISGDGKDDPEFRQLQQAFPLQRGEPLNHASYEEAKRAFQRIAAERGYFDNRFTRQEIIVDLDRYEARVHLHIDTGRRYRFGQVHLEQEVLDSALLERYIRIQPGQPYSTAALLEMQTTLSGTDYFGDVEVIADPEEAEDYAVPVRVRLSARTPNRYTFGIGYGTDTGPRGQLGWERRYLNEAGHSIRSELRASQIESSVNAGYFIPIRNPRTDQLAFTVSYTETDIQATDTETLRLAVSRSVLRGHLAETIALTYQHEKFAVGNEIGVSDLLLPSITWSYLWGDERIYVRKGARSTLELRGASDELGSDTNLGQVRFYTKAIYPVADFGRLIARGDIGATQIEDFTRLPISQRFFAGGDVTVRGYGYNALGPRNADGVVIGGKHLLVGSIEYEQHITGNWAAAIFYDTGNALNEWNEPLARGAGIGVRWRSPIGQIRADVASALSVPDRPLRLHIYIGPDL